MKPPAVLGIDCSLRRSGVVRLDVNDSGVVIEEARLLVGPQNGDSMLTAGVKQMHDLDKVLGVTGNHVGLVVIEGYMMAGGQASRLAQLVTVGTCLRLAVRRRASCRLVEVNPQQLKKYVLGSGKGQKKDQMRLGVYKLWGFEHESDDVVDAYALAQIGLALRGSPQGHVTKPQQEVLQKVKLAAAAAGVPLGA